MKSLKSDGKTIFISSHILPELADVCDNVAIIERGKLKFAGSVNAAIKFATGSRQITFTILNTEKINFAMKVIKSFQSVLSLENSEENISFKYTGEDGGLYEIIKRLVAEDIQFIPSSGKLYDFEQAFKTITTGEVR